VLFLAFWDLDNLMFAGALCLIASCRSPASFGGIKQTAAADL
jgi:hypothetical protein